MFAAEVRAEKARLRYVHGERRNWVANLELWWAKHFNRQGYAVTKAAWDEIEAGHE